MWQRLVASKLLRKTIGSNNFVADIPGNTSFLDLPTLDLEPVLSPKIVLSDHHDTRKFKIFVSTWNTGGMAPTEDINIDELLDTCSTTCDIYVFGFQEVVPLKASNVLGPDKKKILTKWNALIRKALNRNSYSRHYKSNDLSKKQQSVMKGNKSGIESSMNMIQPVFRCLISKQMVGIMISVWVRSDLHPFFRNPSVSCVGCGIMGCLGNKGSVSVRFQLHETSFCFVCCHLASGGREGDERSRNSNAAEILSRTCFPTTMGPSTDLPKKILDHDRIFFLGDLNYRISLPERETRLLVDRKDWNTLLESDQLRMELMDGQTFEAWHEGIINFAPTYKYQLNCDEYYGCGPIGTKSKKKRAPAWCDRIIWTGEGLKQLLYTRNETRLSDHRPVKAMFSTEVKVSRMRYQSFCLSDRFGRRPNSKTDFHYDDDVYSSHSDLISIHVKNKMTP